MRWEGGGGVAILHEYCLSPTHDVPWQGITDRFPKDFHQKQRQRASDEWWVAGWLFVDLNGVSEWHKSACGGSPLICRHQPLLPQTGNYFYCCHGGGAAWEKEEEDRDATQTIFRRRVLTSFLRPFLIHSLTHSCMRPSFPFAGAAGGVFVEQL